MDKRKNPSSKKKGAKKLNPKAQTFVPSQKKNFHLGPRKRFNKLQPRALAVAFNAPHSGTSGSRAPVREVILNTGNFCRMINGIAQCAQTYLGSNLAADNTSEDITNFVQAIYLDLVGAISGRISRFTKCPVWYREIFEALQPTLVQGTWQLDYRFTLDNLPATFPGADNVQWGVIDSNGSFLNGLAPLRPFTPSTDDNVLNSSASTIFMRFYAYGHKIWNMGDPPTVFVRDPSAYAFTVISGTPDFVGAGGVACLEVPIRTTWLAGLGLGTSSTNRVANFITPTYAGPQTYASYRILSYNLGTRGAKNQVRIQRIDIAELMIQAWGTIYGCVDQAKNTEALQTAPIVPFLQVQYYDLFEIYIRMLVAISAFDESSMTLGYQDPTSTYVPLPWGNQFLLPATTVTALYSMFELFIENLRRLKMVGQKYFGVPTYVVNVFSSSLADTAYRWFTARATPTSFSWLTMTNNGSTFYNYNDFSSTTVATSLSGFIDYWTFNQRVAQNYTKYLYATAQTEETPANEKTPTQQVTWFIRAIVPPSTFGTTLADRPEWQRNIAKGIVEKWVTGNGKNRAPVANFSLVATPSGVAAGIIYRRPYHPSQAPYLSLVLPISYTDPTQPNVGSAMSLPMARHMGASFIIQNNGLAVYYDALNTIGINYTHAITNSMVPTELMTVMKNNSDMGLGGAVGDIFGWIGRLVGRKHPKAGKILKGVGSGADALLGLTRFGAMNSDVGDYTSKYMVDPGVVRAM